MYIIIGDMMSDDVITLYKEYSAGNILLKDIPLNKLNKMLLLKAAIVEPLEIVDVILELYRNDMLESIGLGLTVALSMIREEYKNQEFYDKLFIIKPTEIFARVPREYRTMDMCNKLLLLDPSFSPFELIPIQFRNSIMYKKMIVNANDIEVIKDIPLENINQELCNMLFDKFGVVAFDLIPDQFKTGDMCDSVSRNTDDWTVFFKMPKRLLNQEICNNIFFRSLVKGEAVICFENIPLEYRSTSMCKRIIENSNDSDVLRLIPREQLTKIICDMALIKYSEESLEYIPDELKTKEFYISLLDRDFLKYVRYIPSKYYDLEVCSIIALKLKKLKNQITNIEMDLDLCFEVVNIYPELLNVFSNEIRDEIIKRELKILINTNGTLNYISRKYKIDMSIINLVLEQIKEENIDDYYEIKGVLHDNKITYYKTMLGDIENLYNIILIFDDNNGYVLDLEQKIMFAYLYGKCVFNPVKDIYEYCAKKNFYNNMNEDEMQIYSMMSKKIMSFLNKYFKYRYVLGDGVSNVDSYEANNISASNRWIKNYNRDDYIKMQDGELVTVSKYGKKEELLTFKIEEEVIFKLGQYNIPLIDVIVGNAFKEYFKGTLDEYIFQLCQYEDIVLEIVNKRDKRKR